VSERLDALRAALERGLLGLVAGGLDRLEADLAGLGLGRVARFAAEGDLALLRGDLLMAEDRHDEAIPAYRAALVHNELFDARPELRARFFLRIGIAHLHRLSDPYDVVESDAALRAVLDGRPADEATRLSAEAHLALIAVEGSDLDEAAELLASASARAERIEAAGADGPGVAPLDAGLLAVARARLARARGLRDETREGAWEALVGALDRLEREEAARPPEAASLFRQDRAARVLCEWITGALALGTDEHDVLERVVRLQAAAPLARALGAGDVRPSRAWDELIGSDRGVLVLVLGPDRSHLFSADRGGVEHADLPPQARLREAARDHWSWVAMPPGKDGDPLRDSSVREIGRALSSELLPVPVRGRFAAWRAVTLVGAEEIPELAFEALPFSREGTLGMEKSVTRLALVPLAPVLAERSGAAARRYDTRYGAALEAGWPQGAERWRVVEVATPEPLPALAAGALRGMVVVDGPAADLDAAEAAAAGGAAADAAETSLRAGAHALLDVPVDLPPEVADLFAARFKDELEKDVPPAEALRLARAAVAAEDPGYDDPYYHSLVQLHGYGSAPLFASSTARIAWSIGGVLLAALGVGYALRRRRRTGPPRAPAPSSAAARAPRPATAGRDTRAA